MTQIRYFNIKYCQLHILNSLLNLFWRDFFGDDYEADYQTPPANPERQPCKWGRIDRKELKGSRETRMGKWQGKKGEKGRSGAE